MKSNKTTEELLEKQICKLKNTSFAFKLIGFISTCAFLVNTLFSFLNLEVNHKEKQEEFIEKTPYVEFAENDYNQKVAELETKIYNKEIPISEYDKELDKIKRVTKDEYFDKHASEKDKEKYNSLIEAENKASTISIATGLGTFSVALGSTLALCATQWIQESKEKKLQQQREINSPQGGFYCPPDIDL